MFSVGHYRLAILLGLVGQGSLDRPPILDQEDKELGMALMCVGGGMGIGVAICRKP